MSSSSTPLPFTPVADWTNDEPFVIDIETTRRALEALMRYQIVQEHNGIFSAIHHREFEDPGDECGAYYYHYHYYGYEDGFSEECLEDEEDECEEWEEGDDGVYYDDDEEFEDGEECYSDEDYSDDLTLQDAETGSQSSTSSKTATPGSDSDSSEYSSGSAEEEPDRDFDIDFEETRSRVAAFSHRHDPIISQYSSILPYRAVNREIDNPPSVAPLWVDPGLRIPQPIFSHMKELFSGTHGRVVAVRSFQPPENGYGLEPGFHVIKIYSKRDDSRPIGPVVRTRLHLKTELKAYKRLSEAANKKKVGFMFLMQLDAALEDSTRFFLVMELMRQDLKEYIYFDTADREYRMYDNRRIVAQIASGIATLHSIGIIHRDLRPENILLDFAGNVVIIDFGYSKVRDVCKPYLPGVRYCDEWFGTWPYVAPEVMLHKTYGIEADYWSLGCIVYELETTLQNKFMFFDRKSFDFWCQMVDWDISEIMEALELSGLSIKARSLIAGLTHPNPDKRLGFFDLLLHRYFMAFGKSEFHHLRKSSVARYMDPIKVDAPLSPRTYTPWSGPSAFRWVNPRGNYFPWDDEEMGDE